LEQRSHDSLYDPLTGLGNRRLMDEEFPRLWRGAMRTKQAICALFIDIDHFKKFNDDFGHEAGDDVLKAVAKVIQQHARRPSDFSFRWGGEEFALIYPGLPEPDVAAIAQNILKEVQAMEVTSQGVKMPSVTVSIGMACALVTNENITDDLIDMADKAMLKAKSNGRNQCQMYQP
jgi:diguanylate cyclase (GGDEF)-like protein